IFLVSMVGIPPFAGFIGKLFVFQAGINSHYTWLVVIGVLTSVISLYYYMNIVRQMFFTKNEDSLSKSTSLKLPLTYIIIIALCAALTLLMVILPSIFIAISKYAIILNPFNFIK
ncbi:MAG: proton-conducting transporter transmembrane domain-containing protein, partial [Candidatus Humimicrobiaceae bacterium]